MKKKISFLIPCYNEEENVVPMSEALVEQVTPFLDKYDYEIVFIDNCSTDNTRPLLEEICDKNKNIKAIFNARNFGQFNSPFYGMCQTTGDCVISMCCDFQDPVDMIPRLIAEWENGHKIVCAVKNKSKENKFVRFLRSIYYKIMQKNSDVEMIQHFTGTGLYDKDFVDVLRSLDDPTPFLRGIVAELGFKKVEIDYTQAERRAGKTHNNFGTLYDAALSSFTQYSKLPVRIMMFFGVILGLLSFVGVVTSIIFACLGGYPHATTWLVCCILSLLFGITFVFLSLLGEYLITIKSKVNKRPLVVEEKRINFD